ncbi:2'-5'-oligoadenylate synthase 1 isoform X2 [Oryctolagus cuniculus]|uniref:2'-5'-oligoadenylate synthase 1 isoform X2 n=1 Tax=Oryctolagus cuniculus TaxID=9986 RepID=UPI003879EA02
MATCSRMELANTPARFLDKFIEDHLLPDTRFREQVREAVDIICTFLKERCFRGATHRVRVSKVVKGGSSGKGTALRGRSDADLVVFLTNLTSFHEQLEKRREFIREIRSQLKACQREKMFEVTFALTQRSNPRVLSFELRSLQRQQQVEFDVLPAFDALGHVTRGYRPRPQVYVDLIEECTALGKEGEFSTCFTELQRAFLKQRPTKLKSLIRLVKHWYQRCKERFVKKPLPPQYALELLTVYAWERGSGETEFNTARGFRTVLELVTRYQHLRIYWTVYYDFADPRVGRYLAQQLAKPRPVILDPADPTGNVATGNRKGWRRLAQEADAWLTLLCFQNWDGSRVSSWDVQDCVEARVHCHHNSPVSPKCPQLLDRPRTAGC